MSLDVFVNSETGNLKTVVLGDPSKYLYRTPINVSQQHNIPNRLVMVEEYRKFSEVLNGLGINVLFPDLGPNFNSQTPRDIGFVIDDKFVIARMAKKTRQGEIQVLDYLLNNFPKERQLLPPEEVTIEGGDVIYDKGILFVGLGQRTNEKGIAYLESQFPQYSVVPVPLKSITDDKSDRVDALHLDCAFMPIGLNHAVLFGEGVLDIPKQLKETYEIIPVYKSDQRPSEFINLATNMLSLSPNIVVSDWSAHELNNKIRKMGISVIELSMWESQKVGGSYRCGTLPLWREIIK